MLNAQHSKTGGKIIEKLLYLFNLLRQHKKEDKMASVKAKNRAQQYK